MEKRNEPPVYDFDLLDSGRTKQYPDTLARKQSTFDAVSSAVSGAVLPGEIHLVCSELI